MISAFKNFCFAACFLVSLGASACAQQDEDEMPISQMLSSGEWVLLSPIHLGEKRSAYLVQKEVLRATPSWGESDSIFDLKVIKNRVLESLRARGRPNLEDVVIQEISLKRVNAEVEWLRARFYYVVKFSFVYDGKPVPGSKNEVYMLSDGRVVQPYTEEQESTVEFKHPNP